MTEKFCKVTLFAVMFVLVMSSVAFAEGQITVDVNQSVTISLDQVERIAVASPEIADVLVASQSEVLVIGKSPGITTLNVWSSVGRSTYEVKVGANDAMIADSLKSLLGYPDIRVSKVKTTILLEGTVSDQYQKNRAEKVAAAYGDKVVNLLEITHPKQIKIEAKIIEIDRDKTDKLGVNWYGGSNGTFGTFPFGQSSKNGVISKAFGNLGTYSEVNGTLNAMIQNGYARLLSQPNAITVSGEKANIFVGGQIAVPVSTNNDTTSIEWKDYGIKLEIEPEVNNENLIYSKVKAEVSSLDYSNTTTSNSITIPAIKTRKAETVISLMSGQMMAIGGLISYDNSKSVSKLPLLGDLPLLGHIFQSKAYSNSVKEVIILMTPTLVDADYQTPMSDEMQESVNKKMWREKLDDGTKKSTSAN